MYVTRPLSRYYRSPEDASEQPPAGPGSGILVIQDEEAETEVTCCWGTYKTSQISGLPFPQNKKLKVRYSTRAGDNQEDYRDDVFFIPVVGQPLSSSRYYTVRADGRNKGNIWTCSKEEDQTICCLCTFTNDVKPAPFNPRDIYQQVEITCKKHTNFYANAVAPDGIPPQFLRRSGWRVYTSNSFDYPLGEALGLNMQLRARLPDHEADDIAVVGKWYTPFMFVREGERLKDQMKMSMFYELKLEQFWEEVYASKHDGNDVVEVSVAVRREIGMLEGSQVVERSSVDSKGYVWFRVGESGLGLSEVVWERMRWEEERGGWVVGEEVMGRVERVEVFEGRYGWNSFRCYILVERFVFKRMDGSLALTYEFRHTNKVRVKWE